MYGIKGNAHKWLRFVGAGYFLGILTMFDPMALWAYEICFPGAVSGEAEVTCPECRTVLTVEVDDPMGSQVYRCGECEAVFKVTWGE